MTPLLLYLEKNQSSIWLDKNYYEQIIFVRGPISGKIWDQPECVWLLTHWCVCVLIKHEMRAKKNRAAFTCNFFLYVRPRDVRFYTENKHLFNLYFFTYWMWLFNKKIISVMTCLLKEDHDFFRWSICLIILRHSVNLTC